MTQCEILWQQASFLLLTFCDIAYAQVIDLRNKIFDEKTMKMTYVALQKPIIYLCLDHLGFLFFSFFFSKLSLIIINTCPPSSPWTSSCLVTWIAPT